MTVRATSLSVVARRVARCLQLNVMIAAITISVAEGHEMRPALVDLTIAGDGQLSVEIRTNAEALLAGIAGAHPAGASQAPSAEYDRLRRLEPEALSAELATFLPKLTDAVLVRVGSEAAVLSAVGVSVPAVGDLGLPRLSLFELKGALPDTDGPLTWRYGADFGDSVLRLHVDGAEELLYSGYVPAGSTSDPVAIDRSDRQSGWGVLRDYIVVGFQHILPKGLDHILFVVGLYLLAAGPRALLSQVTMFTVAHSVTLALGLLGVLKIPASIVEPLIALSIVYVAIDNLLELGLARFRLAVIFCFGLLHGLGFAGVLQEFGLPAGEIAPALIGFNLGVEAGQITVIALCFLGFGLWFGNRRWYRRNFAVPASGMLSLIGALWFVERVAAAI